MKKINLFLYPALFIAAGCTSMMCHTPGVEASNGTANVSKNATKIEGDAVATFTKFCSSCHGADANVFVDRKWKHGNTKADIVKSIAAGYPDLGMPAWEAALKPQEINALSDYILAAIENRKSYDFKEKPKSNLFTHTSLSIKLDTVAKGLGNPWGMAFLPDGDMIFTDRNGDFFKIDKTGTKTLIKGTPSVLAQGQGGLLDVALHPKFGENKIIYLSYSKSKDSAGVKWSTTALLRAKLDGTQLSEAKDIFIAQPYLKTRHHYGSRIEFDKNGFLFLTVGDRGQHDDNLPQKLDNDCGKVHRLHDDGRIPTDNPFVKTVNARASIWSYGHRNPQGMAVHPTTGEIWTHEHGPRGGDEVNIAQKGKNYGWPTISYGINYDGTILTALTKQDGMEQPLTYYVPSIGPSGAAFVTGDRYKAWEGNFLIGSLRFMYLNRCQLKGNTVTTQENLLKSIGRLRFVEMGSDGYLYVGVEEPGFIFRLMPVAN